MTFCETSTVKGRKRHRCSWCGEVIEKGEEHIVHEGHGDEGFFRCRMHKECDEADKALTEKYPMDRNEIIENVGSGFARGHTHEPGWGFEDYCPGCQKGLPQ